MTYVDGFLLSVPKKKIPQYRKLAKLGARIWKKHGALEFRECIGDDMKATGMVPFPKLVKPKAGETVVFSFIVFKSRAHRDAVNKKVMKDPALCNMATKEMPFDCKRMAYGGFKVLVES